MQNTTHAVMAQRHEPSDSLDDFPTPPWATRALIEHVIDRDLSGSTCLEPACGAGHMAKVLTKHFGHVHASDVHPHGYGQTGDFLEDGYEQNSFDWVITNPPFRSADRFVRRSLHVARVGVAILARTVFLEGKARHERIFQPTPPAIVAQFVERVPMVRGRLDKKATTATGYAWFVWHIGERGDPVLKWIPPCRKALERDDDYEP